MNKTIVFDLGETLIHYKGIPLNWSAHYKDALAQAFKFSRVKYSEEQLKRCCDELAAYNTRIHPRDNEISSEIIFGSMLDDLKLKPGQLEKVEEGFFGYFQRSCTAYPETVAVLQKLKDQGTDVAILTDVPYGMPKFFVEKDLQAAGIKKFFKRVLTSVETGYRKPHKNTFLHLAKSLALPVQDLIYVGNEKKDIQGANEVGAFSILIDRDGKAEAWGEKRKIKSLDELGW
jgi:putative hydrolase of the HAD superfamily